MLYWTGDLLTPTSAPGETRIGQRSDADTLGGGDAEIIVLGSCWHVASAKQLLMVHG
jgi:hypothetical protein